MKSLLKDNLMLVISISLPVVLVLLFLLARFLPTLFVAAPQYDVLLGQSRYADNPPVAAMQFDRYRVIDGRLHMLRRAAPDSRYPIGSNVTDLFRYHPDTGRLEAIEIDFENYLNTPAGTDSASVPVTEVAALRLSEDEQAPDGYRLQRASGGGGLMRDLFGVGSTRFNVYLAKSGRIIAIDTNNRYLQYIAWIVD